MDAPARCAGFNPRNWRKINLFYLVKIHHGSVPVDAFSPRRYFTFFFHLFHLFHIFFFTFFTFFSFFSFFSFCSKPARKTAAWPPKRTSFLNECFNSFTTIPVQKYAKNTSFWARFWTKIPVQKFRKSSNFWIRFWTNALVPLRNVRFKNMLKTQVFEPGSERML